jgi:hypothetical protein
MKTLSGVYQKISFTINALSETVSHAKHKGFVSHPNHERHVLDPKQDIPVSHLNQSGGAHGQA